MVTNNLLLLLVSSYLLSLFHATSIVVWVKSTWAKVKKIPSFITLSQKQFGKYFSAEIFPASMGIVLVLFKKISIQQHPRKKYL